MTFMWADPATQLIAIYLIHHGLPVPFHEPGWNKRLDSFAPGRFFDLVATAIEKL